MALVAGVFVAGACTSSDDSSSSTTSADASATADDPSTTADSSAVVAPVPAGATEKSKGSASNGGTHTEYTTTESAVSVLSEYEAQLKADGWTMTGAGGGGGEYGGGGGLAATKSPMYLEFGAGGGGGLTTIDLCVWPSEPRISACW